MMDSWNAEQNRVQDISFDTLINSFLTVDHESEANTSSNLTPETLSGTITKRFPTQYRGKRMLVLAFLALILASGEFANIMNSYFIPPTIPTPGSDKPAEPNNSDRPPIILNQIPPLNKLDLDRDIILSLDLSTIGASFLCTLGLYLAHTKRIPLLKLPYLTYMLIVSVQNDYQSLKFLTRNYWHTGFEPIDLLWIMYFLSIDVSVMFIINKILYVLFPIRFR